MEIIGFLIQTISTALLIILILHSPLWFIAKRKGNIKKWDYLLPFIPFAFYLLLNILGISKQSIANLLIEIPIVILITLFAYTVKVFSGYNQIKKIIYLVLIIILLFTLSMPLIIE